MLSDPIEDLLTPYRFDPFKWFNECPYIIDLLELHFEHYGFEPLIEAGPLYGIHIDDQILIILIEFNRITSRN